MKKICIPFFFQLLLLFVSDKDHIAIICQRRLCAGKFLEVAEVKETETVIVTADKPIEKMENLRIYFQRSCSIPRTVDSIEPGISESTLYVKFKETKGNLLYLL